MTERKPRNSSKKRASLGFVLMLLLSSLGALATVPAASAALPGSIGITDSISPMPNAWYSSFDIIEFEAEATNYYAAPSGAARTLTWYACEGDITTAQCKSVFDDTGQFNIGNVPGQSSQIIDSADLWSPGSNAEGIFTIIYTFSENDQVAADDEFRFHINLTSDFVDVIADTEHNPLEHLANLAVFDDEQVLNTNTDYVFKAKVESTLCCGCAFSG